jgi:hypothetical protein
MVAHAWMTFLSSCGLTRLFTCTSGFCRCHRNVLNSSSRSSGRKSAYLHHQQGAARPPVMKHAYSTMRTSAAATQRVGRRCRGPHPSFPHAHTICDTFHAVNCFIFASTCAHHAPCVVSGVWGAREETLRRLRGRAAASTAGTSTGRARTYERHELVVEARVLQHGQHPGPRRATAVQRLCYIAHRRRHIHAIHLVRVGSHSLQHRLCAPWSPSSAAASRAHPALSAAPSSPLGKLGVGNATATCPTAVQLFHPSPPPHWAHPATALHTRTPVRPALLALGRSYALRKLGGPVAAGCYVWPW